MTYKIHFNNNFYVTHFPAHSPKTYPNTNTNTISLHQFTDHTYHHHHHPSPSPSFLSFPTQAESFLHASCSPDKGTHPATGNKVERDKDLPGHIPYLKVGWASRSINFTR